MSNAFKTTLLLGALTGLLMWIGQVLGGTQGLVFALIFAAIMNFGSYWFSDRIVLAAYGARPLSEEQAPDLFRVVRELATGARLSHAPGALAAALEKIAAASGRIPLPAGPATAHLWIVNPLRGNWLANLFSTHPPIEERVRRLRGMAY